jgi:hypothetical protein
MADAGLDFAFSIRIGNFAGHCHGAVMSQHVAVERIQNGVVEVRRKHGFAQVIRYNHLHGAPEFEECAFVQFSPDASARLKGEKAYALAAVAQRHHKESRAAVLAGLGITNTWPGTVINLRLFSWSRSNHGACFWRSGAAQLADIAPHALVSSREVMPVH